MASLLLTLTVVVWLVRDCGLFPCHVTANFEAGYCALKTTETLINYTACYQLAFIFSVIFLSILLHLFSPCVWAAILFDKFWLYAGFCATWQCVWMRKAGYKFVPFLSNSKGLTSGCTINSAS